MSDVLPFDPTLWSAARAGAGRAFAAAYRVGVIPGGIVLHPSEERNGWDIELLGCNPPPEANLMAEIVVAGAVARALPESWMSVAHDPSNPGFHELEWARQIFNTEVGIMPRSTELSFEYFKLFKENESVISAIAVQLVLNKSVAGDQLCVHLAHIAAGARDRPRGVNRFDSRKAKPTDVSARGGWGIIKYAPNSGTFPEEDVASFDGWYSNRGDALAIAKDWSRRFPQWIVALVQAEWAHFGNDDFSNVPREQLEAQIRE
jgi:hypothetical protein